MVGACLKRKKFGMANDLLSFHTFWDPTQEWILPVFCPIEDYRKMISAEELLQAPENGGRRDVTCPVCFNSFSFEIKTAHGDPRNIAYTGMCN